VKINRRLIIHGKITARNTTQAIYVISNNYLGAGYEVEVKAMIPETSWSKPVEPDPLAKAMAPHNSARQAYAPVSKLPPIVPETKTEVISRPPQAISLKNKGRDYRYDRH